jgi:hypothetical protein
MSWRTLLGLPPTLRSFAAQPWVDDIELKLLYDFGPHMSMVSGSKADTWAVL